MFKNSSAKYYQKNKETFQKTLVKGIDLSVENENKKNMVVNDIVIFWRMRNKG